MLYKNIKKDNVPNLTTLTFFRKAINSDHAPEILFSDEYYPQIVSFLQDQQTQLTSFKFNFVLTVIYESPLVRSPEDDAKSIEKHEMYRKGKKFIFFFLIVGLIVA